MTDYENLNDSQILNINWKPSSLRIFQDAMKTYLRKILPEQSPGNTTVAKEVSDVHKMIRRFRDLEREADGESDHQELIMGCTYYKLLSDVLHKYWSYKRQLLAKNKEKSTVEGAFEGEEDEVKRIRALLQNELFVKIPRRKALVQDLFERAASDEKTKSEGIKQQISIGNLYGQAVFGDNYGTLNQEVPKELLENLQQLFKVITENQTINSDLKSNALGDVQTIQSQLLKRNPSKIILQGALKSLSAIADARQVGELFVKHVAPYIGKIKNLINQLPF